ncbi:MAG: radical SAM protein, partial [Planctomycetota bacterium]
RQWRRFLEEMARRHVDVYFYVSIRASDIVRDADILDLYRRAGILYVLIGVDSIDPKVIGAIRKRSTTRVDYEACQLLKRHGIRSIVGHIVGLEEETWADFRRASSVHSEYGVDLLNVMYATPHSWTRFAQDSAHRLMVQADQRCWDYRHQVLRHERLMPWQLFVAVKWLEFAFHMRPGRLARLFRERNPFLRRQLWWTTLYTGVVWLAEIAEFLFSTQFTDRPRPLSAWLERANRRRSERGRRSSSTTNGTASTSTLPAEEKGRKRVRMSLLKS